MIYNNVFETIGNTPLVKINKLENNMAEIYVKLESFNPGGSVKDRATLFMILDAEERGIIKKGDTIIEATSGNTGISLAMIGASRGYKVIIVMPDTMSIERRKIMKAYGAELILTEGKLGMAESVSLAENLSKEKKCFLVGQFTNNANVKAHIETTAIEIFNDMNGELDAFVAGVGTGGTVTGVSEILKEKINTVKVFAVQPEKSQVLTGGSPSGHKIQGIGANFIPEIYNGKYIDEIINITEEEAYNNSRYLGKEEGILAGISSGANFAAARKIAKRLGKGKKVVVILPDTGERYLSTDLFSE